DNAIELPPMVSKVNSSPSKNSVSSNPSPVRLGPWPPQPTKRSSKRSPERLGFTCAMAKHHQSRTLSPFPSDLLSFLFLHCRIKISACSVRSVKAFILVDDIRING